MAGVKSRVVLTVEMCVCSRRSNEAVVVVQHIHQFPCVVKVETLTHSHICSQRSFTKSTQYTRLLCCLNGLDSTAKNNMNTYKLPTLRIHKMLKFNLPPLLRCDAVTTITTTTAERRTDISSGTQRSSKSDEDERRKSEIQEKSSLQQLKMRIQNLGRHISRYNSIPLCSICLCV